MPAIDIGTTYTKAAVVDPTGKPMVVNNARGEPATRSCIHLSASGDWLVGEDACEQGAVDPVGLAGNFKLRLGTTDNLLSDGRWVTPTDATAALAESVKADLERKMGCEVRDCVATVPANSLDSFKQAHTEALEKAGIHPVALWAEPTAAVLAYELHKSSTPQTVAVYDLGGGTFDVSVVRVDGAQHLVLATEGIRQLGGNDFNEVLRQIVYEQIETNCGCRPDKQTDALAVLEIDRQLEQAKRSLAVRSEVRVPVTFNGQRFVTIVDRQGFEAQAQVLVDKSIATLETALKNAGVRKEELNNILLVGGSGRLPIVQRTLTDYLGRAPLMTVDPEKAVVCGAALAFPLEMQRLGRKAMIGYTPIPAPAAFVVDVTAHAVGVTVLDKSTATRRLVHSAIIAKNTPIPCHQVQTYFLEEDQQTDAQIEFLQGPPEALREECLILGQTMLTNLPLEQKRTARVHVDVTIDRNAMAKVVVTDLLSGQTQTITVDYKKGVHPNEPSPATAQSSL